MTINRIRSHIAGALTDPNGDPTGLSALIAGLVVVAAAFFSLWLGTIR